jgi:hypothetical protein
MTWRWWNRVTAIAGLCLGGVLVLTACIPPGIACPAIGYITKVDVHVDGELAWLDACAGSECGSPSSDSAANITIWKSASGTWTIEFISGAPDELTLQAFDTSGALVAEEDFELQWTPAGNPGLCPGPVATPALEFSIR